MSTTSRKHTAFVSDLMGLKPDTELAGIREALGESLNDRGYQKAYQVFGKFLILKIDEKAFTKWLKETTEANTMQERECYLCLKEWCAQFI